MRLEDIGRKPNHHHYLSFKITRLCAGYEWCLKLGAYANPGFEVVRREDFICSAASCICPVVVICFWKGFSSSLLLPELPEGYQTRLLLRCHSSLGRPSQILFLPNGCFLLPSSALMESAPIESLLRSPTLQTLRHTAVLCFFGR